MRLQKGFKIGVDVGATRIKMALVDGRGRALFGRIIHTPLDVDKSELSDTISVNIEDILKQRDIRKKDIRGIGVGVPGPVDWERGIVRYFPNIRGWNNVPFRGMLQKKLGIRVALDNDVNAMTLGEFRFGAGKGAINLICITLGTGVGGGIIINGEIYRGSTMCAGEIGHIPINEKGPKCNCKGTACLERYIGNRYILKTAEKAFRKNVLLEDLTTMARKGNKKAVKIWKDVGKKLGIALTGVVNLLNPDRIVIGDGVSKAGEFILGPLRDEISARAMKDQANHVKIVRAKLDNEAGVIGASLLIDD